MSVTRLQKWAIYHTEKGQYKCKPLVYLGFTKASAELNTETAWTFAPLFETDYEKREGKYMTICHYRRWGLQRLADSIHLAEDCPDADDSR